MKITWVALLAIILFCHGCKLVYWDEDFESYENLSLTNPYPYHAVQKVTDETGENHNEMMAVQSGLVALQLRIDMIRRARHTIELEYFIFTPDLSGKIIIQELLKARQERKVNIRLLIDKSASVFEFDERYAAVLARHGIEVRYYNAAPIYSISTINFRNHRKLLVVDDLEAITGGRNIENDYFDLSPTYNFLDRDMYVKGTIVAVMRKSFDAFWDHSITERLTFTEAEGKLDSLANGDEEHKKVVAFYTPSIEEKQAADKVEEIARPVINGKTLHNCPETTFTSDAPGGSFWSRFADPYSDKYRFLRKTIFDKVIEVDKEIIIASPYMLHNKKSEHLMGHLLDRNVQMTLYTNSLSSTDATYVAARLYEHVFDWHKLGITIYLHAGEWIGETPAIEDKIEKARWGMHAKTHIYKTDTSSEVMVGTYNIDNRSNHYNAEMGLFCKGNPKLVEEVESNILARAQAGYKIVGDQQALDRDGNSVNIYGAGQPDLSKMKYMWLPSWLFEFLL